MKDGENICPACGNDITGKQKNIRIRNITLIFVFIIGISLFIFLAAFIRPIGYFLLNIRNAFDSFWMAFGISPRIGGDILFFGIFIVIIFILKKIAKSENKMIL